MCVCVDNKNQRILRQILFMEDKLCPFPSFGPNSLNRQFKVPCLIGTYLLVLKNQFWRRMAAARHWWGLVGISSLVQKEMPGCSP